MKLSYTPDEVARMDEAAIASGTPADALMEAAGWAVARAAIDLMDGSYGRRVVVLCGKGNNGGDGFVAARYLSRAGALPVVFFPLDPQTDLAQTGPAANNHMRLRGVRELAGIDGLGRELARADLVIDAMLGTGAKGKLRGPYAQAVEEVDASALPVVAVDVPTGVDGASGNVSGRAIKASVTVTMGALKDGLILPPGCDLAGRIVVADIGTSSEGIHPSCGLVGMDDLADVLTPLPSTSHKRSVGTVLLVAGSVGMSGAAALAARGALRTGAGMVIMAVPASIAGQVDGLVPEALTLSLPETPNGVVESSAVAVVLEASANADVVALGPGLSSEREAATFTHKLVDSLDAPLVLDADGINHFAGRAKALARFKDHLVMTPHPGEMGRLLGISSGAVQADRMGSVRRASAETESVVLLKGYRSLVAAPSGEVVVIGAGGPALAAGGSGDVLTGATAALVASGLPPFTATWAASFLHAAAGDRLSQRFGDRGVVASDIPDAIAGLIGEI